MKHILDLNKATVTIENNKMIIDYPDNLKSIPTTSNDQVQLSNLKPKDEFKIGDEVFIVLEQSDNDTKVISKEFAYTNKAFGDCSDWKKSPIRTLLNGDYYNKIAKLVGASNIISMERDLTSLDGLDDYGTCNDKISLLSASEYAKYHKILGLKSNYPDWWWTITPASTPSNDYSRRVCCVDSNGILIWYDCDYCYEVRPFLCLHPSTMVKIHYYQE